jgi:hypothetical protein
MPGQRAALAAAGLPEPPAAHSGATAGPPVNCGQDLDPAADGAAGPAAGGIEAALLAAACAGQEGFGKSRANAGADWLPGVLAYLSGGAALAAACGDGPTAGGKDAAPAGATDAEGGSGGEDRRNEGRRFVGRWLDEAGLIQARLDDLDEGWGPGLVEPCVAEGWRGHYTLP